MNQSSTKKFISYVRVSSKDQARGTSLDEQKAHIMRYAESKNFEIVKFYGEVESASTSGREIFDEMIDTVKKYSYSGLIFHKVDRSARNPKDQAMLYELMQKGYELHFVLEGLSTTEPMGRNMMYLLWGMASGYSENLRAEINKGIDGRLKQGRMPNGVPIGYKKIEGCKAIIDTTKEPFVKKLFEEYATGKYSVQQLGHLSKEIGLTNKNGRYLSKNTLHTILRNTFYYGLITHKRGVFQGDHQPMISKTLFDKVQYLLKKKGFKRLFTHEYVFSGALKCPTCGKGMKSMTAKKKWKYYYCRNKNCEIKTVAETELNDEIFLALKKIEFNEEEIIKLKNEALSLKGESVLSVNQQNNILDLEISTINARLESLLQKFIDEAIDLESYNKTRGALLNKQIDLKERKDALERKLIEKTDEMEKIGKLLENPSGAYQIADPINKRRLIESMVENLTLTPEGLCIYWKKSFYDVIKRYKLK